MGLLLKGRKSPLGSRSRGIVRDLRDVIWRLSRKWSYTVVYIDYSYRLFILLSSN
jgi:hypothetical protein